MDNYLFISYSRVDENEVRELYSKLQGIGYDCWLDVDRILSGSDWDRELQKAIENCSNLIVICTPSSMSSKNVNAEWQYAFDLKKSIHPVILKPCEIPFRLRIYQHVDATKVGLEGVIQKLAQSLPTDKVMIYKVDSPADPETAEIRSLISRSAQNWKSFGLLLDAASFTYVDKERDNLQDLDASTTEFLYLSARKLRGRGDVGYWANRVLKHSSTLDSVENFIVDEIRESSLYESQTELTLFASIRLISKIAEIISISDEISTISLLLDASIYLLLKSQFSQKDLIELESVIYEKFVSHPNPILARALGWIESSKMLNDIQANLERSQPLELRDIDNLHLVCLANMRNLQAISILEQFTPDGFSFIPAGWFLMGSNDGSDYLGNPEHEVFVPSFWLRVIPVTQLEFQAKRLFPIDEVLQDIPAHNINWNSAKAWIDTIAQKERLPLALPTEAMWEKAASWNPTIDRKQRYPWGDKPDESRCNTIESGRRAFTPVGAFSPRGNSPYGIMDMVGNVWEWTVSPWRHYPYQPRYDRNPKYGLPRVMRGPSQDAKRGLSHGSSTRVAFEESYSFENGGMRIAIVIDI